MERWKVGKMVWGEYDMRRQSVGITIKHTCAIEISFSESNRNEIEFEFDSRKWENNTLEPFALL